ncbi:MAG TPA: hypothetical protein VMI54_21115 [Polyangiaceae bacterium]|nr:hypothetical protein [Polyangiaceae bacterium]
MNPSRVFTPTAQPSAWLSRTAALLCTDAHLLVDAWREGATTLEQKRHVLDALDALASPEPTTA